MKSVFKNQLFCFSPLDVVWTDELPDASPIEVDESEIPQNLKKALLWLANQTKRREIDDGVDDIYEYSKYRYFIGEELQGIIGGIYKDCIGKKHTGGQKI